MNAALVDGRQTHLTHNDIHRPLTKAYLTIADESADTIHALNVDFSAACGGSGTFYLVAYIWLSLQPATEGVK